MACLSGFMVDDGNHSDLVFRVGLETGQQMRIDVGRQTNSLHFARILIHFHCWDLKRTHWSFPQVPTIHSHHSIASLDWRVSPTQCWFPILFCRAFWFAKRRRVSLPSSSPPVPLNSKGPHFCFDRLHGFCNKMHLRLHFIRNKKCRPNAVNGAWEKIRHGDLGLRNCLPVNIEWCWDAYQFHLQIRNVFKRWL